MIVFYVCVDVYHYVFDYVHVSVYCLTFLWMFIIPFSQCSLYLLCMQMFMCLFVYMHIVFVCVDVDVHV